MEAILSARQRAFLWALAHVLVPETRDLSPERQKRFFAIIEETLATRPKKMLRLLGIFLVALRWIPLFRFGGRLDRLPRERQISALLWFEEFPVPVVRTGFWGVKTLLMMGHYTQAELLPQIGYTPSKAGNEKLHA